ncbi:MAG: carbohydrate ABC transporter permease [Actinobacteria bacterium]|nr:carbohydrate ABC transporter permease [Actinomycetota bacterium]
MARDKITKASVKRFLGYAALVFFALVFILPFVLTIVTSFKTLPDIQQNPVRLWADPKYGWTLDGIRGLNTSNVRLPRWAFNSVVVTVSVVAGRLFFDSIAGFALAKMRFRGRRAVFGFVIVVLAVPGVVLLIPKFLIMKELGILNTYAGLILPLMFDAFGIFLMKQFFEQLPDEMLEAAAIDGATTWQIFTKVALPLAAPALIALTILSTAGVWNDFMHPLIAVPGNPDLQTLPLGLANIRAAFGQAQPWNTILAGTMLATLPIAIIFFIFQRYFVQGLATSGTKG